MMRVRWRRAPTKNRVVRGATKNAESAGSFGIDLNPGRNFDSYEVEALFAKAHYIKCSIQGICINSLLIAEFTPMVIQIVVDIPLLICRLRPIRVPYVGRLGRRSDLEESGEKKQSSQ